MSVDAMVQSTRQDHSSSESSDDDKEELAFLESQRQHHRQASNPDSGKVSQQSSAGQLKGRRNTDAILNRAPTTPARTLLTPLGIKNVAAEDVVMKPRFETGAERVKPPNIATSDNLTILERQADHEERAQLNQFSLLFKPS